MPISKTSLTAYCSCILLLNSCINYQDVAFKGIRGAELRSMNGNTMAFTINAEVENPNDYSIKLKKPDVDLWINGQLIGKAVLDSTVVLDKNTTRIYPVYVSANTNGMLGPILMGGLAGLLNGTAELKATGTVVAQVGLLRKRFPFDVQETLELQ